MSLARHLVGRARTVCDDVILRHFAGRAGEMHIPARPLADLMYPAPTNGDLLASSGSFHTSAAPAHAAGENAAAAAGPGAPPAQAAAAVPRAAAEAAAGSPPPRLPLYSRSFSPAANDLLQKYLSPHLMSEEERHMLELQRVREAFRKHEGDCGSSEVQIALLTQRIKHVAAHLQTHRKDKHSRRGLDGMLQRRRKLLKYLRRKDWDSYCDVISRLGLRDRVDLQT